MKYKIEIVQTYRVTRKITVEVEADYGFEATEKLQSGEVDVPSFDDPAWVADWNLMNEEYVR